MVANVAAAIVYSRPGGEREFEERREEVAWCAPERVDWRLGFGTIFGKLSCPAMLEMKQ